MIWFAPFQGLGGEELRPHWSAGGAVRDDTACVAAAEPAEDIEQER